MDSLKISNGGSYIRRCFYRNMSSREAAETFCVSERTVQMVLKQFNGSRTVKEAGTSSGHYRELLEAEETVLLDIAFDNLGIYLDGEVFSSYNEQTIIATLQPFNGSNPQSILIMDNASIHHIEEVVHMTTVYSTSGLSFIHSPCRIQFVNHFI